MGFTIIFSPSCNRPSLFSLFVRKNISNLERKTKSGYNIVLIEKTFVRILLFDTKYAIGSSVLLIRRI